MSLVVKDKSQFQHILRLLNTNVEGKQKIMFALTAIKGVGRRYSNLVCKKADIDVNKRAGELSNEELERIVNIIQNPLQYKIPLWFLNRQKDIVDGENLQVLSNGLDNKLREDLDRLKKMRSNRGLRHYWGLTVRGQHTKTTGRRGRTVGVATKKKAILNKTLTTYGSKLLKFWLENPLNDIKEINLRLDDIQIILDAPHHSDISELNQLLKKLPFIISIPELLKKQNKDTWACYYEVLL